MAHDPLALLLSRLHGVKKEGPRYIALCPCHEDRTPSLAISTDEKGVQAYCFGCKASTRGVFETLGLEYRDSFFERFATRQEDPGGSTRPPSYRNGNGRPHHPSPWRNGAASSGTATGSAAGYAPVTEADPETAADATDDVDTTGTTTTTESDDRAHGKKNEQDDKIRTTAEISRWKNTTAVYIYCNGDNTQSYLIRRFTPTHGARSKSFTAYRTAKAETGKADTWRKGMESSDYILFRLPQLQAAIRAGRVIYIVEGEAKVMALERHGEIATCNTFGAGHWRKAYGKILAGAKCVVILPDNDDEGRKHAHEVAATLYGQAQDIRIVELKGLQPKGDIVDFFQGGCTIQDLWAAVANTSSYIPPASVVGESLADKANLSDWGNAKRLVARHGETIRWVSQWKEWIIWDGRRWAKDHTGRITWLAKDTVRNILRDAAGAPDQDVKTLVKFALQSENQSNLRNLIESAKSEPAIPIEPDVLDVNPWLLNCNNGTIELQTGGLFFHDKNHLNTKIAPVAYDPNASCPTWMAFLFRVMDGRMDLVEYLQRAVGYTLTGDTSEHCLFLLHGAGRNGKSTFIDVVHAMLGSYANTSEFSTWLEKKSDAVRDDLADLQGARFVSASEADSGRRLSEAIVKQASGGDLIKARFLFGKYFSYQPQFKLYLATNHKPVIRGQDNGIWSRIKMIPFEVTIPIGERDKALKFKLFQELPGILAWAMRGCLEWQQRGLQEPAAIVAATDAYRREMDTLAGFFQDCVVELPGHRTQATSLYQAYSEWFGRAGGNERDKDFLSRPAFGRIMLQRNYKKVTWGGYYYWDGLCLLSALSPVDREQIELTRAHRGTPSAAGDPGPAARAVEQPSLLP